MEGPKRRLIKRKKFENTRVERKHPLFMTENELLDNALRGVKYLVKIT
jgi:hypothetical protein